LEKALEAVLGQMAQMIVKGKAERFPCILLLCNPLDRLKSANNAEITLELDILPEADWASPICRKR